MTLDLSDLVFLPADSVGGGLLGLLAQTMTCFFLGAIPGLILRVNFFTVSLLYVGILFVGVTVPFAMGSPVYSFGMVLIGISAGAALHETIRQVAKPNRH